MIQNKLIGDVQIAGREGRFGERQLRERNKVAELDATAGGAL